MFENLTEKFEAFVKKVTGRGKLSEENIQDALKQVRLALLEADVNYKVVKAFVENIRQRAVGKEVLESLTPGQQLIKIVNEELIRLMGGAQSGLDIKGTPPHVIMLVGLQGSGKTTTAVKLAYLLRKQGRHPYLVSTDVTRPAAIEQLQKLGQQIDIPVYPTASDQSAEEISFRALNDGKANNKDVLIIDTAGRLHIDEPLMKELSRIKDKVHPAEIILVADAMTGQDAVHMAEAFDERLNISGVILSKMEGDARGGAALSIKAVTNKPIKFIGTGEKIDALESFFPDRIASQILGMGDVLTLIEKAQEQFDEKEALKIQEKLSKNIFDLEDFRSQLQQMKRLGSMEDIISMLPGSGRLKKLKQLKPDEKELIKAEAIINSMTKEERKKYKIINGGRRRRIARGSGNSVQDVNRLLKNFAQMKKVVEGFGKKGNFDLQSMFR